MQKNLSEEKLFIGFSLFWVILAALGLILTWFDSFSGEFLAYLLALGVGVVIFLISGQKSIKPKFKLSKPFLIAIGVSILVSVLFVYFSAPSVFSGRDQGSYAQAAIELSQNHKLAFSNPVSEQFFKIYGEGQALNFPGFYYDQNGQLNTQFPLGYIVWLALFFSIFGLKGFAIANAVAIFIFLVSFYLIASKFSNPKVGLLVLPLVATSFIFFWFAKFTLSENLALALLWLAILLLIKLIREKNLIYYFLMLLAAFLFAVCRIEGVAILPFLIAVSLIHPESRKLIMKNKLLALILPLVLVGTGLAINFYTNVYFVITIAKAALNDLISPGLDKDIGDGTFLGAQWVFAKTFMIYGFFQFILGGLAGIIYLIKNKKFESLIPLIIVLPIFIYLVNPNISTDHPWMLRRYMFAILPALILYCVLLIGPFFQKKTAAMAALLIILLWTPTWPAFLKYFTFYENKSLLEKTENIGQYFSDKDLVLVDQTASGDGWSMLSGPLMSIYGKDAAYFFNPQDLDKIDTSQFDKVFIITPGENESFYQDSLKSGSLSAEKGYKISTERLENLTLETNPRLPQIKMVSIEGKILKFEVNK